MGFGNGARGRNRTDMAVNRWILSPLRLPVSPLGQQLRCDYYIKNKEKLNLFRD